jgi:hypothetical protein
MFQFAAFYDKDLEILPGATMNLVGPIHTNGSLYLGSNATLNVNSQVTLTGDIFNRRKDRNETYPNGRVRIRDAAGNSLDLLSNGTGSTAQTRNAMDAERVEAVWGSQVKLGMDPVIIPSPEFIDKEGAYYENADLRINYKPAATNSSNTDYLSTVPFDIQVPIDDEGNYRNLTEGQLRSLRQPVMVSRALEQANYCNASSAPNITNVTTNNDVKRIIVESLQTAIASQEVPLEFTSLDSALNVANPDLKASFEEILEARLDQEFDLLDILTSGNLLRIATLNSLLNPDRLDDLSALSPKQIAAIAYTDSDGTTPKGERCFVNAPIGDIGRDSSNHESPDRYYNDREGRDMRLLQTNIESMTIWN